MSFELDRISQLAKQLRGNKSEQEKRAPAFKLDDSTSWADQYKAFEEEKAKEIVDLEAILHRRATVDMLCELSRNSKKRKAKAREAYRLLQEKKKREQDREFNKLRDEYHERVKAERLRGEANERMDWYNNFDNRLEVYEKDYGLDKSIDPRFTMAGVIEREELNLVEFGYEYEYVYDIVYLAKYYK